MSTTTGRPAAALAAIRADIRAFIERQTRNTVSDDLDLFGSGLVSSLFAMQLVTHVESTFGVTVAGPDLTLANFRTVTAMADLVGRLRGTGGG